MMTLTTNSRPPSLIVTIWVSSAIAKERRLFRTPKLSLISIGTKDGRPTPTSSSAASEILLARMAAACACFAQICADISPA